MIFFSYLFIFLCSLTFSFSANLIKANYDNLWLTNGYYSTENQLICIAEQTLYDSLYNSPSQLFLDVYKYIIIIDVDIEKKIIRGEVEILFGFTEENPFHDKLGQAKIELNFRNNMKVASVRLNNSSTEYKHLDDKLIIENDFLTTDTNKIIIKYDGKPMNIGLSSFVFGNYNNIPIVYTLNAPTYASTWLPCNDLPSDKALVDFTIICDSNLIAISNGVLFNTQNMGSKKIFRWKNIYPISTYLICFSVSEYKHFYDYYISAENDTMQIDYYSFITNYDKAKIDWEDHPKMIEVLSHLFGEYPFIKEKYGVTLFLWSFGAMEHQTITSVDVNLINGRKLFQDLYVHELAHHWWGNSVTPKTWADVWLSEGFASYSEALYNEYLYGKGSLIAKMETFIQDSFEGTVYNPNDTYGRIVYYKGAWTLHMLRFIVGDKIFWNILKEYYSRFKYSNACTKEFINLCEELAETDLTTFFNDWIYSDNNMLDLDWNLETIQSVSGNVYRLNITQRSQDYYTIPLEVKFVFDDGEEQIMRINLSDYKTEKEFKSSKKVKEVIIDPNRWLLANIEGE